MRFRPPLAPARLRLAAVPAARALVRAVFAVERAVFAADRARFFVFRAVVRARLFVLRAVVRARFFVLPERLLVERLFVERFFVERLFVERLFVLRELLELFDEDRRLRPPLRSAAGISSRATPFARRGISRSRNFAIRSSSRRISRAILAVSLSPTVVASVSIAV